MIRVVVAEDHSVVRQGLEHLLGMTEDIELVACAHDGAEAVELTAEHDPDVVLMDLEMPRVDGIAATREIVSSETEARIVVLTSFSDHERILQALDAGAIGYLLKDAEPQELLRAFVLQRVANRHLTQRPPPPSSAPASASSPSGSSANANSPSLPWLPWGDPTSTSLAN